jgi:hypothetical protein
MVMKHMFSGFHPEKNGQDSAADEKTEIQISPVFLSKLHNHIQITAADLPGSGISERHVRGEVVTSSVNHPQDGG